MAFKIVVMVGARPNFMKAAPILAELRLRQPEGSVKLIHTGQHYDEKLSDLFFRQLEIPQPDINLNIGSGTHATQTAQIMLALEEQFLNLRPDLVIVAGDVNSTLAAALVASKMHNILVAHVEAGLRSFDRTMPEEINRVLTDAVSDLLFLTERSAEENLHREGIAPERLHFVGNTMIDTLLKHRAKAEELNMPGQLGVTAGNYALVTLHRPSNVDTPQNLQQIMSALLRIATFRPVIFPVHPRTLKQLKDFGLLSQIETCANFKRVEPLGYLEFVGLMAKAGVVLTDSGGIQEETTILNTPCLTIRDNTERPVTITHGTNVLVGLDPDRIVTEAEKALSGHWKRGQTPEGWDGHATERMVDILLKTNFEHLFQLRSKHHN